MFLLKKRVEKDLAMITSSFIDVFRLMSQLSKIGVVDRKCRLSQAPLYRKFRRTELPAEISHSLCLGKKWRLLMN